MDPTALVTTPASIAAFSAGELDELLARLEREVPAHPPCVTLGSRTADEAVVFGDSHGDWKSTEEVVVRFRERPEAKVLVGLGDYIDRAPPELPAGSAVNALFLLSLAAASPDRVFLLKGNHELARVVGARPHTLPEEMDARWGRSPSRYARLMALLERGPLVALTESGAYLAHAGFPRGEPSRLADRPLDPQDPALLLDVTWPEPDVAGSHRGAARPWGRAELDRFLQANGLSVFLRGHDPDLTGKRLYGDRVLTLHTCRLYRRYGGVLAARLPLDRAVRTLADVKLEQLTTGAA